MQTISSDYHETWSSPAAFILAAIGAAVGLGNIWRFPYLAGENGGGAFVLIYLLCIVVIGIPLLMAEIMIGRRSRQSPINGTRAIAVAENRSPMWQTIGWLAIIAALLGLMFFTVIAGWTLEYLLKAVAGEFIGIDAERSGKSFDALLANPLRLTVWHSVIMASTIYVVARGIRHGIEKAVKWIMPALFIILVILVGYAAVATNIEAGLQFMFAFDFSKITPNTVLMAVGQAFFSITVCVGSMMTYGAYMPQEASIPRAALTIAAADTGVAILAGIAIFSIVFAYGLEPAEGPGLIYVTLPIAFGHMPGGTIFGILFFLFLAAAAFTSSISLLEPIVSWAEEHRGVNRVKTAILVGLTVGVLGLATVFSFNILSDFTPLDMFSTFSGMTIFDLIIYLVLNILLLVGGVLMAIFAGWMMKSQSSREELNMGSRLSYLIWQFLVRFIAPVAVIIVFLVKIFSEDAV
jgi:neurotransmitter:Na+ symporter, NSS family